MWWIIYFLINKQHKVFVQRLFLPLLSHPSWVLSPHISIHYPRSCHSNHEGQYFVTFCDDNLLLSLSLHWRKASLSHTHTWLMLFLSQNHKMASGSPGLALLIVAFLEQGLQTEQHTYDYQLLVFDTVSIYEHTSITKNQRYKHIDLPHLSVCPSVSPSVCPSVCLITRHEVSSAARLHMISLFKR